MRCPAYPMCSVELDMIDGAFPVHGRVAPGLAHREECPGSGARIMDDGALHGTDRLRIQAAGAEWVRRVATQSDPEGERVDADTAALLRGLLQADVTGVPLGHPADRPTNEYFPGRPADAPEPGVGERPAGRPAMDLGGGFLGRAAVDNARDQLRQLLSMAIDQMAQGQDTLARMTGLVDSVTALAQVVNENLHAAEGLVNAAIGSGTDAPEAALRLRAQLKSAAATVTVSSDGITMALRVKIEQTFSQIAAAIEAANEYRAIP